MNNNQYSTGDYPSDNGAEQSTAHSVDQGHTENVTRDPGEDFSSVTSAEAESSKQETSPHVEAEASGQMDEQNNIADRPGHGFAGQEGSDPQPPSSAPDSPAPDSLDIRVGESAGLSDSGGSSFSSVSDGEILCVHCGSFFSPETVNDCNRSRDRVHEENDSRSTSSRVTTTSDLVAGAGSSFFGDAPDIS